MAETAEQIEAKIVILQNAIDSGVLSVRHGETSTTYKTTKEMENALVKLKRRLGALDGLRSRVRYPWQRSKGL